MVPYLANWQKKDLHPIAYSAGVLLRLFDRQRQISIRFADPRRTYTRSFERYVVEFSRHMTVHDVALHLGVGWDLVKEIQRRHLVKRFSRPQLKRLKHIAIDEISIGKDHRYLTVVLDLLTGVVVFVGDGKEAEALDPFWRRLKRSHAKIEAVAMTCLRHIFLQFPATFRMPLSFSYHQTLQ